MPEPCRLSIANHPGSVVRDCEAESQYSSLVPIRLIPATLDEFDWLFESYRSSLKSHISRIWGWDEQWQLNDFREGMTGARCELVERDGSRIGFIRTKGEKELDLQLLVLLPEFRRYGHGASIVKGLKQGRRRIVLKVFATNVEALRFYIRQGFVQTGADAEFYSMMWVESSVYS